MTLADVDAILSLCLREIALMSAAASVLIIVLFAMRLLLGVHLSPSWRAGLWLLIGLRLMLPIHFESPWSLSSALRSAMPTLNNAPPRSPPIVEASIEVHYAMPGLVSAETPIASAPPATNVVAHAVPRGTATVWLVGVIVLLARQVLVAYRLHRRVTAMKPADDPHLLALVADAARTMRIRRPLRVVHSGALRSPAVCGVWQATLILPDDPDLLSKDADLRLVLLHELAHVRGRDVFVSLLVGVVCAVHWFNPLVWLAARWRRDDRELACDAAVLRAAGDQARAAYGLCLLRVAERVSHLAPHPAAIGVLGSFRHLKRRILMISQFDAPRSWPARICGAACAILLSGVAITCAPAEPAAAVSTTQGASIPTGAVATALAPEQTTRTYDIRDFLVVMPDFESEKPALPVKDRAEQEQSFRDRQIQQLVDVICNTINSDSWRIHGGMNGVIQELGGQLIITQTPAAHAEIAKLLSQLREHRSLQISVSARFIRVDADRVPPAFAELLNAKPANASEATSTVFVPADKVDALVKSLAEDAHATTLTAPRVTLFNSQRALVKVNTEQSYIADFQIVENAAGERTYEPKVDQVHSGVIFDVQATASADRKYVTLTLKPSISKLQRLETIPFAAAPDTNLIVQKPVIETQEMNLTLSMPDGGTCVIRSGPDGSDRKQILLLLVTPTVIDLNAERVIQR